VAARIALGVEEEPDETPIEKILKEEGITDTDLIERIGARIEAEVESTGGKVPGYPAVVTEPQIRGK
jgi:hypothetical protein